MKWLSTLNGFFTPTPTQVKPPKPPSCHSKDSYIPVENALPPPTPPLSALTELQATVLESIKRSPDMWSVSINDLLVDTMVYEAIYNKGRVDEVCVSVYADDRSLESDDADDADDYYYAVYKGYINDTKFDENEAFGQVIYKLIKGLYNEGLEKERITKEKLIINTLKNKSV